MNNAKELHVDYISLIHSKIDYSSCFEYNGIQGYSYGQSQQLPS